MFTPYSPEIWVVAEPSNRLLTIAEFKTLHPTTTNVFIAKKLGVSPATVRSWVSGARSQTNRTKMQLQELHQKLVSGVFE